VHYCIENIRQKEEEETEEETEKSQTRRDVHKIGKGWVGGWFFTYGFLPALHIQSVARS
jgi:hypothetical protein